MVSASWEAGSWTLCGNGCSRGPRVLRTRDPRDARGGLESLKLDIQRLPDIAELAGGFKRALDLFLRNATGVFVLGGDQVRLMHALKITGADVVL